MKEINSPIGEFFRGVKTWIHGGSFFSAVVSPTFNFSVIDGLKRHVVLDLFTGDYVLHIKYLDFAYWAMHVVRGSNEVVVIRKKKKGGVKSERKS